MFFEEALKTELVSISGFGNKVFPLNAIEGTIAPYVVYISSEGVTDEDLSGFELSKELSFEVHVISDSYGSMKDLVRQTITKVKSFQGRIIGGSSGVFVWDVEYEDSDESYNDDLFQYISSISFKVRI
jgi:hypothetical protein